jgi:hypothetical protein
MSTHPSIKLVTADRSPSNAGLLDAAEVLARGDVLQLRLGHLPPSKAEIISEAEATLAAVVALMKERHGLPGTAYVEVDEESYGVPVAAFRRRRFLLPHQDGGHSSFLTPSRIDCPELQPRERLFSNSVYSKRPSHKMFQGFIITSPDQPLDVTCYYNAFTMLRDAFVRANTRAPKDVSELASFLLQNLRWSRDHQSVHRSRYFNVGAMLGSRNLAHHVLPSGPRAESELWPEQYANLPELCAMVDACPCGVCSGPGERLLCHATVTTLGLTWPAFRTNYEASVAGRQWDLLVGNNLSQLHAADSGLDRTIRPLSIVMDLVDDDVEYERWLSAQWWTWWHALERAEDSRRELNAEIA